MYKKFRTQAMKDERVSGFLFYFWCLVGVGTGMFRSTLKVVVINVQSTWEDETKDNYTTRVTNVH